MRYHSRFSNGARADYFLAAQAFNRIVETGSFIKAATQMDLHPNAVTKLVQALEAQLRVLDRSPGIFQVECAAAAPLTPLPPAKPAPRRLQTLIAIPVAGQVMYLLVRRLRCPLSPRKR